MRLLKEAIYFMETNYVKDKVIIITGAAGTFGGLVARKASALGGKVFLTDIKEEGIRLLAEELRGSGAEAAYYPADVCSHNEMFAMAAECKKVFDRIDVIVNIAGTMPIAYIADHEKAWKAWDLCIDVSIKGTLYGMEAVHDIMIEQGQGQIINLSSIWGNFPAKGAAAYIASKASVRIITESFNKEARGKIKTTVIRPTGVPTGLMQSVINGEGNVGILQDEFVEWKRRAALKAEGKVPQECLDPNSIQLWSLPPQYLADNIIYAINQPWGVNISDITVRASGDLFML